MNKTELLEKLKDRYNLENKDEYTVSELADMLFQTYVDLRRPELEEQLEKFEGSQYKTFGQIQELEEMEKL